MAESQDQSIAQRVNRLEGKVDKLNDKIDVVDDKYADRHLEQVRLTAEMKAQGKATQEATERMADSVEGLVGELKQSNKRTDTRFDQMNNEIINVKSKVEGAEEERRLKIEEKKLSNGVLISIITGGFILLQVIVNVLAPILFG